MEIDDIRGLICSYMGFVPKAFPAEIQQMLAQAWDEGYAQGRRPIHNRAGRGDPVNPYRTEDSQ